MYNVIPTTMENDIRFFATPKDFRKWFEKNHDKKDELVGRVLQEGSGKPSITWPESVDQAFCFGWIDGIRKSIDDESYKIRFTPRRARSIWSAVNIKRIGELIEEELSASDRPRCLCQTG